MFKNFSADQLEGDAKKEYFDRQISSAQQMNESNQVKIKDH